MKPGVGKSIWAVAAGFLTAALLSIGMDAIMHGTGIFPPMGQVMSNGLFFLATAYRCAFQALGGYLTASLAPMKPMKHVWILAGIGQAAGLLGIPVWMSMGPEAGPLWYPLALVVTAIPSVWAGGYLRMRRSTPPTEPIMAKKENALAVGISEPEKVNAFMQALDHPLSDVVVQLRKLLLSYDKRIGEGIFWNAPTFYFTGKMKPFDPKEYKRYVAGFNLFKKDAVRVILLRGSSAEDPTGLLEGDYKDGRRLMTFTSLNLKGKEKAFKNIIVQLVQLTK